MKTIEKTKKATNPTEEQNSGMISVVVEIPTHALKPYEAFARKFHVPVNQAVEADIYIELEALDDQIFINLEALEKYTRNKDKLKPITLEFSPSVHAMFATVAQLLRRTIPELIAGLAAVSAYLLERRLEEARTDVSELQECVETVKFIREFRTRAEAGGPPIGPTGTNGWDALGLIDPEKKEEAA